ncbi:hypothetical protein LIA77_07165 [Sarocladium implicatum]|nr:hypothetical protein LIA77_07165 [Sarocladium implicatum]
MSAGQRSESASQKSTSSSTYSTEALPPTGGPNSPEQPPSIIMTRSRCAQLAQANASGYSRATHVAGGSDGAHHADLAYLGGAHGDARASTSTHKRRSEALQNAIDDIHRESEAQQYKRLKKEVEEERRNGRPTTSTSTSSNQKIGYSTHGEAAGSGRPPRRRPRGEDARTEAGSVTEYVSETEVPEQFTRRSSPSSSHNVSRRHSRPSKDPNEKDPDRGRHRK